MVYVKHHNVHTMAHIRNLKNYSEDDQKTSIADLAEDPISDHLKNIFPYIVNDQKTIGRKLVSGYHIIDVENADEEFLQTKEIQARKTGTDYDVDLATGNLIFERSALEKNNAVLAHHLVQSFSPEDELTPEQIHEIGRQTVMELTDGDHEFVIATHVDQDHIHNHIVFNSTNMVTGKAFNWKIIHSKNGKTKDLSYEAATQISDRIAAKYGAKIIEKSPKNTHQKYTVWQAESRYKSKIKQRLDHLLKCSRDIDDLKTKAAALNLAVDFSKKWATYKLLDEPQIKNTRGRSLSKKQPDKYNLAEIKKTIAGNPKISTADCVSNYVEKVETIQNDFDYQLTVEPWQIESESRRGVYVKVEFGVGKNGTLFVPGFKVDQLEDGNFAFYIKQKDYFYFMDGERTDKNKYLTGEALVKQLSLYNGTVPLKKEPLLTTVNELMGAINFLADQGVTDGKQVETAYEKLNQAVSHAKNKLKELDDKIIALNQVAKKIMMGDLMEDSEVNLVLIEKEIETMQRSRNLLQDKFSETVTSLDQFNQIVASRDANKPTDKVEKLM
ncbi:MULTISPECIES: relaxase/mobilization nuclease domain-containing protein [Leuconostoc]|uniref:Transcription elongation factor GreAB n=1 Tax=Leuconostoc inhae TaxID=178001 RepID=A0ABM9V783_9LACO|nr:MULTISPECIES: relaxase/mobilization nuclease domain-containing protein [Leuconostoc]MBZ5947818.1 relaxase/mobilization nuclease domain-containing protein [Leuconostoc gasicomitatum]MBZ5955694.1 relaxase/mobilization nuclease domain-containing protein [Leuconostoc gasicomitatum]MBZ5960688.1 relaxase/mobilization nuclease domain-containing protein [Leuconostoc gasicomitatum]MBZ5979932.1 relaxase/mobilization nuclease domain-containing protein [Leuconostoc gasicomitatum]MBZ5983308.1 relaxase/m